MSLQNLVALSNRYGKNPDFVLAGGGNTSFKDDQHLFIKPSGISLEALTEIGFVKMKREKIRELFQLKELSDSVQREAMVKKMMADAVCFDSVGRPSVEAPLHEIIPFRYVVHLHPAVVNGMTCGRNGKDICARLFPQAMWLDYTDPGYTLAASFFNASESYKKANGSFPAMVFLKNHGVFVGADTTSEIESLYDDIMLKLNEFVKASGVDLKLKIADDFDSATVMEYAPQLRSLLEDNFTATVVSMPYFQVAPGPLTPDHIVYAKSFALETDKIDGEVIEKFEARHGYKPKVVAIPGKAIFAVADNLRNARIVADLARDAARVKQLTDAFGGADFMTDAARIFIENWEVESYRKKVSSGNNDGGLSGRIALVTGGAQGFGYGIADELAGAGCLVAIADMNLDGAVKAADELCRKYGVARAIPLKVNIADESSVAAMFESLVGQCGGLDIFIANAGVLRTGSVKTMEKKDWDFVTDINYTGYFLCSKYAARVMSVQNKWGKRWTDIVQVNSKSGLVGSNKNGAYAGSKFGTIGLTQSFALELIEDRIKVNSICPGNFFDGPLWMDPQKGLFVQYLNSGKVPGAKTLEDVKAFYESKIPMNRGCFPADVAKAITYAVHQQYETGQAIPVTGGQVMLS
ncbi:MAG: SDR family NAD(P)-dependent oxidoreductase [Victivallaceae bacterium]|nr:SDR family NAD(P)-dependent oxidoreductase [Victivallaceae bacterium]